MLQALVAEQREWKEKNYHYLQEQICAIPCRSLILTGQKRNPPFYVLILKMGILHFPRMICGFQLGL